MKIATLIKCINTQLAGELLSIGELADFVDRAIDDINTRLNTKFPVLTDMLDGKTVDYTAIPDKYIRTVVIPGAAFKYYTTDEEGAAVAPKYEEEYLKGLFYMERDYLPIVPPEFIETYEQGALHDPNFHDRHSHHHKPDELGHEHPHCVPVDPYNFLWIHPHHKEGEFTIDGSVFEL